MRRWEPPRFRLFPYKDRTALTRSVVHNVINQSVNVIKNSARSYSSYLMSSNGSRWSTISQDSYLLLARKWSPMPRGQDREGGRSREGWWREGSVRRTCDEGCWPAETHWKIDWKSTRLPESDSGGKQQHKTESILSLLYIYNYIPSWYM